MVIKPGDVLFIWGNTFVDDAIEFVTSGPSHCALFLNDQTLAEAQVGRVTGEESLSAYLHNKAEVWTDETLTDDQRNEMVSYAKSNFGIHYDYLAILAELVRFEIHFPLNFHEGKRRICSSYVNDCAKAVNKNWSNAPFAPAPVDLIKSGKLTKKGAIGNGQ